MDDPRFKALLDAYGADVERWPEAEREAGRRRLAAAGGAELAEARAAAALDSLLAEARKAEAHAPLIGRIMASLEPPDARTPRLVGAAIAAGLGLRASFAAVALLLVSLGVLAGWSASRSALGAVAGDALLVAAYGEPSDDLFAVGEL